MNTQYPVSISRQIFQENFMSSACKWKMIMINDIHCAPKHKLILVYDLSIRYYSMSILRMSRKVKRLMHLLQES